MEQIMQTFRMFFFIILLFSFPVNSHNIENARILDVNFTFQKLSHQNPWLVGEPFTKKTAAIYLGNGIFFAMTQTKQNPSFAEFDSFDFFTPKLTIKSYDSETGFTLMKIGEVPKSVLSVSIDENLVNKTCPKGKTRYVFLPFSKTPIRVFLLDKKETVEPKFVLKNNVLCGIEYSDYLIPTEYVNFFVQSEGLGIPHPGLLFDIMLTPSEIEYYSTARESRVLVTEAIPGVGPAYNLFPGDLVFEINSVKLGKLDNWDKSDRIYDLLLRNSKDKLRKLGEKIELKFFRNNRPNSVSFDLRKYSTDDFLIPDEAKSRRPLYLIAGGFFFTELTNAYLKEFGDEYRLKSEKKLLYLTEYYQKKVHPIREKIVILSRVFPLEGNLGYHDFSDIVLEKVNGIRITSLSQLKNMIQTDDKGYFAFEFSGGKIAFFSRREIIELEQELQNTYRMGKTQNIQE